MAVRNTIDWQKAEDAAFAMQRRALAAVGAFAVGSAQRLCPVDTGNMRSLIGREYTSDPDVIRLHCYAPYAGFVEFGHLTTAGNFVPPDPFFRNAIAETAGAFGSIVADASIDSTTFHHERYPDDPNQSFAGL